MKIKVMIFSLMTVFGLQASQYEEGTLPNAIELLLGNRRLENDNIPIIFHGTHLSNDIKKIMNDQTTKRDMYDCSMRSALLISDIDFQDIDKSTLHEKSKGRKILRIELGEKIFDDNSFEVFHFADNNVESVEKFDDRDRFKDCLKRYKFVIFNMRHPGMIGDTNFYADEIGSFLTNNEYKTSILAVVGQEFNGIDVEELCIKNGKNPIVFNKPKHPMIIFLTNNWKVITGVSIAGLLALIYKIIR